MDLISELESELSALTEARPIATTAVRIEGGILELAFPELGLDYLAGLANQKLFVVPIGSIREILGSALPIRHERTLDDFLSSQRTPVRVKLSSAIDSTSCWLLNIDSGWIRVSSTKGISWLPISAIVALEILPVDN